MKGKLTTSRTANIFFISIDHNGLQTACHMKGAALQSVLASSSRLL